MWTTPNAGTSTATSSRRRRARRNLAVGAFLVAGLLAIPDEAHGIGNPFKVFTDLFNLVSGPIGGALSSINGIAGQLQGLYQQTVWPLAALNQARGSVATSISKYRQYTTNVFYTPTTSATLPGPQQLEAALHSRTMTQIPALQSAYSGNYGAVPASNQAAPQDRVMMDVDDAFSQENLKTTVASDQAQDQLLATANAMENQVAVSTPGSAPFLTAQAQVANLRSQAYIQKMLAAELRQEAGRIAHDDALLKRRAQSVSSFNTQINSTLSRQQ